MSRDDKLLTMREIRQLRYGKSTRDAEALQEAVLKELPKELAFPAGS